MAIGNEDENTKKGESLFNISYSLIGIRPIEKEYRAFFSLRRKVRSALIIVNQTSGRGTVPAEKAPELRKYDYCWNRGEYWRGGARGGPERCLANMRGNGDREISTDRITFLGVVIFSHDKTAFF